MKRDPKDRGHLLEQVQAKGGLTEGVARELSRETGIPEAEIYGTASFYHLLADPDAKVRVCTGLSCVMRGAEGLLDRAKALGLPAAECACLAACDRAPAVLKDRAVLVDVTGDDLDRTRGDWTALSSAPGPGWAGAVGPESHDELAMDLLGSPDFGGAALDRAREVGPDAVIAAAVKWRSVRAQHDPVRYVVLNADEGEPGTFKDREVMLRRPDLVLEGLAIAAEVIGATDVYLYLRGEFGPAWRALEASLERFGERLGCTMHLHAGHGAYICGEETALLEALEGKRGMPRLKPPFPTEVGLWGKPTLIHNVETIACVPNIVLNGGEWFRRLGQTGPGTKLYCISGDVVRPGVYELPLGVTLEDLVAEAGGYEGELYAFSPGGASSGFLPAGERERPLDFKSLAEVGSMLGSAGVVVLNDTRSLLDAVRTQLRFFEAESCGQCAPCRIGTQYQRMSLDVYPGDRDALARASEVAWEMNEGSICGLGQAASLPLTTVLRHFPGLFATDPG